MSCSTCGSNVPCSCARTSVGRTCTTGCACGNPTCCGTGCCGNSLPATPLPFYACAPACPENHKQTIVSQQFYFDITAQNTWNVPTCGESAVLSVPGLRSLNVGSYIWNLEFGYFEVTSVDITNGQITVVNHCNDGNAASGTNVPACTLFTVTVPPCDCSTNSDICVAIDFTAPENGDCIDITLTTTAGLTASDTVQIGSGFYFLEAIKPNDIVTICNHGDGIAPGTPVIAKDADGNYQYCLSIVSTNPCDRTSEAEVGALLGCGTDDVSVPLGYLGAGWVATQLRDNDTSAAYRPLGASDNECTTTTAVLTFVNGDPTYTLTVTDTSSFLAADVLEIQGGSTFRFTVTTVTDATHMDVTVFPVPSGAVNFPIGSVLCLQSCCETLQTEIDDIQEEIDGLPFVSESNQATDNGPFAVVTALNPTLNGANFAFSVTNPSSTKSLKIMLIMRSIITGDAGADLGPPSAWAFGGFLVYTLNGGAPNSVGYRYSGYGSVASEGVGPEPMDFYVVEHQTQTIAPSGVLNVVAHGQVAFETPDVGETSSYTATKMVTSYSVLGVPG